MRRGWQIAVTAVGALALLVWLSPPTQAQISVWLANLRDGSGNAITSAAAGSNRPLDVRLTNSDGARVDILDPCLVGVAKTYVPFSISTATTTQLVAASASNHVYICAINIVAAGADNVALVEDATSACASPDAGMAGGTTAATGWNFAANGGLTLGNGSGAVIRTAGTNVYVCLITPAATQLSGTVAYVAAP